MIGVRENAASYGPKSSMVLSEARRKAWVRGSGQVSDDVCWQRQRSRLGDCKVSRLGPRSPRKEKMMAKRREKRECRAVVLEPDASNPGSKRFGSLPGQRALLEERSWPEERCLRLPVDSVSALSWIAESQLPPTHGHLCGAFSMEASGESAADGLRAHPAYAEVAQPDESADPSRTERHHRSEWASDSGCDPR